MKLIIELDVSNPEEVIKAHKGVFVGLVADIMLSKQKKKDKIEKLIYEQIREQILLDLPQKLEEEGVVAYINCEITEH